MKISQICTLSEVCPEDFSKVIEKLKSTEPTPYIRKRCFCDEFGDWKYCQTYFDCQRSGLIGKEGFCG